VIRYLVFAIVVFAIHANISLEAERAIQPANMDGSRLLQMAVEQGEAALDRIPPEPCYAEVWALERAGLALLSDALRYQRMGEADYANAFANAAGAARWAAEQGGHDCR
jgi:hypothetical protein